MGQYFSELCRTNHIVDCVESGTANGYSACWLASGCEGTVYTFDPVDRLKVYQDADYPELHKYSSRIVYTPSPFVRGVPFLPILHVPVLYFIDGEHSAGQVLSDFESLLPRLSKGDFFVFDDIEEKKTGRGFNRVKGTYPHIFANIEVKKFGPTRTITVTRYE